MPNRKEILDVLYYGDEHGMTMGSIAAQVNSDVRTVRQVVYRMRTSGLIESDAVDGRYRYMLTEDGVFESQKTMRRHGTTASQWIELVRAGIDRDGRETRVQRAKTPSCAEYIAPKVPPIEEWIDARRQGRSV